jgi:[Skp1-protein]-hydroxyproline N-acetylglucosaminyltransferase
MWWSMRCAARPVPCSQLKDSLSHRLCACSLQVLPCQAARFAITVWFYRGEALPPRLPPPLPLPSPASLADVTSPIFVSIASHRDPETPLTIEDCFARAAAPERIHVGVLLQLSLESGRGPPLDVALAADMDRGSQWGGKVTILSADSSSAAGPVPARAVARSLWQGEPYVLQVSCLSLVTCFSHHSINSSVPSPAWLPAQIDSHMRFRPNWDVFLISQLQACPSAKPILTTYPPDYFPKPSPPPSETRPTVLVPSGFGEQDGLLRQKARLLNRVAEAPLPSPLWAAGFSFSTASALLEVPYDPLLRHIFFGEEISMAARLYTSGFDFYAPSENVLYHLWSRADRPNFREQRPKTAKEEEKAALLRLRALLIGSSEGGESAVRYSSHFGLGSVRPIQEVSKSTHVHQIVSSLLLTHVSTV